MPRSFASLRMTKGRTGRRKSNKLGTYRVTIENDFASCREDLRTASRDRGLPGSLERPVADLRREDVERARSPAGRAHPRPEGSEDRGVAGRAVRDDRCPP